MIRNKHSFFILLITLFVLDSCSSGKKAFEQGNYYEAVITSVNRLRRDADHKKSVETLHEAYPLSVSYFEDRAKAAIASNTEFKWSSVVQSYSTINTMYDEIRRSPGALKVIPNPVNYYAKLEDAKRNAAEERYAAGLKSMELGGRDRAKQAYYHFVEADKFMPGYKEVQAMMEAALLAATIKVAVDPIPVPSRNIGVSAEFFDNKVSEFLHSTSINDFVKFYTPAEIQNLAINPDHQIVIAFDEFVVGQVFMQEREVKLEKDSVVVASYIVPTAVSGGVVPEGSKLVDEKKESPVAKDPVIEVPAQREEPTTTPSTPVPTPTPTATSSPTPTPTPTQSKDPENKGADSKDEFPVIDEKDKVTVCHVPPGNESNRHDLIISRSALSAHLAHGDTQGSCESVKEKSKPTEKTNDPKGGGKKSGGKPDGSSYVLHYNPGTLLASSSGMPGWMNDWDCFRQDTVKVYGKVKATLYHYRKTTTSKGVLSFKIIDSKTGAILSAEKMPGEFVWISEWATLNGDERALSEHQLQLCKQKELVPPQSQELFIEFTRPIFDQLTTKITDFYKRY